MAVLGAHTAHASVIQMTPNNIGLVGYWSFNEGTSTIAHDFSGNGNTGTLTTSGSTLPQWVPGKFGTALSFDGSTDYVSVPSISLGGDVTFSAWVKLNSNSVSNWVVPVIAKGLFGADANGDMNISLQTPSSATQTGTANWSFVVFNGASNTEIQDPVSASTGAWTLIVGVKQGTTISLYKNGVLVASSGSASGAFSNSSHATEIGAYPGQESTTALNGSIDDVRVYNRALTATEVAGLYKSGAAKINSSQSPGTLSNGLVGWWTMDGADTVWSSATAGTEADKSGNGNTGTLTSMTRSGSPTVGKIGQALKFDGTSQYISVPALTTFSALTVSLWLRSSTTNTVPIGQWGGSSNNGYGLYADGNWYMGNGSSWSSLSAGWLGDNAWHLYTLTWDGATMVAYRDGARVGTPLAASGLTFSSPGNNLLTIGADNRGLNTYYAGSIDDVRVYNRALSASEVKQLYGLGAGTHVNTSSQNLQNGSTLSQGLMGLWTFDGPTISGTTVKDLSGNGNNGNLYAAGTAPTIGKLGQALYFGAGAMSVSSSTSINQNNKMTIGFWIKGTPSSIAYEQYLYDEGANSGWEIQQSNLTTGIYLRVDTSGGSNQAIGGLTALDGHWHQVVYTLNQGAYAYYEDGSLMGSGSYAQGNGFSGYTDFQINPSGNLLSSLDDVRIYNRALSASEVQHLYLMGK